MILLFLFFYKFISSLSSSFAEREDFDLILPIYKIESIQIYDHYFAKFTGFRDTYKKEALEERFREMNIENIDLCFIFPLIHFNIIKLKFLGTEEKFEYVFSFLVFMYSLKYKEYFSNIQKDIQNNIYFKTSLYFFKKINLISEIIFSLYSDHEAIQKEFYLHLKEKIKDFQLCNLNILNTIQGFTLFIREATYKVYTMYSDWSSIFDCDTVIVISKVISLFFNLEISNNIHNISFDKSFNTKIIKNSNEIINQIYSYKFLNLNRSFENIISHISIYAYNLLISLFTDLRYQVIANLQNQIFVRNISQLQTSSLIPIEDTLQSFRRIINQSIQIYKNPRYEEFDLKKIEIICQSIYVKRYEVFCEIEYARVWGFCINRHKRLITYYREFFYNNFNDFSYNATIILSFEYCIYSEVHSTRIFSDEYLIYQKVDLLRNSIAKNYTECFLLLVTRDFLLFHYYSKCEFIVQFCISDYTYEHIVESGYIYSLNKILLAFLLSLCRKEFLAVEFLRQNKDIIKEIHILLKSEESSV